MRAWLLKAELFYDPAKKAAKVTASAGFCGLLGLPEAAKESHCNNGLNVDR
jgi:hypothetical protein